MVLVLIDSFFLHCSGSHHVVFNNDCVRPETKTINWSQVPGARDPGQSRGSRGAPDIRSVLRVLITQKKS